MAKRKARTDAQKELDTDKRLQRKFGITLADREERRRQQENKCKICGGPLDAYGPPNIDHYHFHIKVARHFDTFLMANSGWDAVSFDERGEIKCTRWAMTKTQARVDVKKATMPWSIRGLLCFKCNRGLGSIEKFFYAASHPENLLSVIEYLRARLKSS